MTMVLCVHHPDSTTEGIARNVKQLTYLQSKLPTSCVVSAALASAYLALGEREKVFLQYIYIHTHTYIHTYIHT